MNGNNTTCVTRVQGNGTRLMNGRVTIPILVRREVELMLLSRVPSESALCVTPMRWISKKIVCAVCVVASMGAIHGAETPAPTLPTHFLGAENAAAAMMIGQITVTLEILPGQTVTGGSTLIVEAFIRNDGADFLTSGVQLDLPCNLPAASGSSGEIRAQPATECLVNADCPAGAICNTGPNPNVCNSLSIDNASNAASGSVPWLFAAQGICSGGTNDGTFCINNLTCTGGGTCDTSVRNGGLRPIVQSQCRQAGAPGPGEPSYILPGGGTRRYLGTFRYEASSCAAGTFNIPYEGLNIPCQNTDLTRVMEINPNPTCVNANFVGGAIAVPVGACCDGTSCVVDGVNEFCCENGLTNPPAASGTWTAGELCTDPGACGTGQDEADIRLTTDFPHQQAEQELLARGAIIQDSSDYFDRISCRIDSSQLEELGAQPWVVAIQLRPTPAAQNDGSRLSIGVLSVQDPPWGVPNSYNLSGFGVKAGIWDQGQPGVPVTVGVLNAPAHADLTGRWFPEELNGAIPADLHHTHVAGTMAGDGRQSTGFQWAGMAPEAEVHTWDFKGIIFTEMLNGVLAGKIDVSQNSWAYPGSFGHYWLPCGEADKLVWDKKLPIFFAAGNYQTSIAGGFGTVTAPATAKNVVAVGAVTKTTDAMAGFSSWGPTLDGRLKPDVVAVGVSVNSCSYLGGSAYLSISGTSMACPAVSGLAALLIEKYGQLNSGNEPDPALLKANLLNCATDLGNPGPDFKFGYGKVNAVESVKNLQNVDYLYEGTGVSSGVTHTYYLDVPAGCVGDLKVLLAWSDREYTGISNGNPTLINDLDFEVTDPGGSPYLPLTLNPTSGSQNNLAVPLANHRDNVEQVVVAAPTPGVWTIKVHGFSVPQGPQPYALTWFDPQNCIAPPPPPCAPPPAGMVAWYTGDDTTPIDHLAQHDGTFTGVPFSSVFWKVGGGALGFSSSPLGSETYVHVPDPLGILSVSPGAPFSVDTWVMRDPAPPSGHQPLLNKRYAPSVFGQPSHGYYIGLFNGNLRVELADGLGVTNSTVFQSNLSIPADGQWHFVAVTVQRTSANGGRMYVDGAAPFVFNASLRPGSLANAADLLIGAGYPTGGALVGFDGLMDEIELFDRELTPQDVTDIFLADVAGKCKCTAPPADMVAWWPLDETAGATSFVDIIGGNDATPFASPVGDPSGPQPDTGVVFGAIHFPKLGNGLTGARVAPSVQLNNVGSAEFTIDAWVKFDAGSPANDPHYIVNKFDTTTSRGYAFYIQSPGIPNNERLEFKWGAGPGNSSAVQTISALAPDQWYFVAVTVRRNVGGSALEIRLYVNGVQEGVQFVGNPVGSLVNFLFLEIGWQPGTIDEPITLDELEIFERALSVNEILRIYRAGGAGKCTSCRRYGDVYPEGGDGVVEIGDLLCILDGYNDMSSCPGGDIAPCGGGDGIIELSDILAALDAYAGSPPCSDPCSP